MLILNQKNLEVMQLAKEIEIWAASLRYKNNDIDERISLESIYHLDKIATGSILVSNDLEQISHIIRNFEEVEKAPESISNKLLLLCAFYKNA